MYQGNECALKYAANALREDKDFVLAAVNTNGGATLAAENGRCLSHASEALRDDDQVVLAAVKRNWLALQYASKGSGDQRLLH